MTDIHLEELQKNLKHTISTSESVHNVSAAMSQNRSIIAELFSRKKESETV